jgi:hypothetical protein
MSRKDELLKVANVFHLQAKRSVTPTVKWALHKMGDEYQREAETLHAQLSERRIANDLVARDSAGIQGFSLQKMQPATNSKIGRLRRTTHVASAP